MANEIQVTANLQASKSGAAIQSQGNFTRDMAGSQMVQNTQSIPTAWTLLVFGNLAGTPAKALIRNLDTTNYVELAEDNAGAHKQDKLLPNGDFVVRSPVGAIYAKANGAACILQFAAMDA